MDLNKKIAFKLKIDEVDDVDDVECPEAGDVDSEKLWHDVECNILKHAFPGRVIDKFSIKPSFKFGSPFMGKQTEKMMYSARKTEKLVMWNLT